MHRSTALGVLLIASLLWIACDSGGGNDIETITGTWRGTVERQGTEYTVALSLGQLQGGQATNVVRGEGEVRSSEETFAFSISSGTFSPASNEVTFPQQYEMGRNGQIRGTVDEDLESMTVTIIGGPVSFDGEEFTLNKDG